MLVRIWKKKNQIMKNSYNDFIMGGSPLWFSKKKTPKTKGCISHISAKNSNYLWVWWSFFPHDMFDNQ